MNLRSILGVLLLLALALLPLPARAQDSEDEDEDSGFGHLIAEISTWIAQPQGLAYSPATRHDPGNVLTTDVLRPEIGTKSNVYTKIGYVMPGEMGTFMFSFYDHEESDIQLSAHDPGNFIYGESMVHPLFAGYSYDGLVDSFTSASSASMSDFRFDFVRKAFERPKVTAEWFVGVRRFKHSRGQTASYSALVPDLPVLLPPLGGPFPGLDPRPDTASQTSGFAGRGLEAGMNFEIPLLRKRLTLEAGFAVASISGDIDATYRSRTNYYVLDIPTGTNQGEFLLLPPFDELEQTRPNPAMPGTVIALASETEQRVLQIGFAPNRISTSSDVLETHVGLRWQAWKDFTFSLGYRSARYSDVGLDLRPVVPTIPSALRIEDGELLGLNLESFTEVRRSVTYDGVFLGLGYKF